MKNIRVILCSWLFAMSATSFAQVNNIYLGPEGGPGLGILWGNSSLKQNRIPELAGAAGYAFQYNFTKIISIRTCLGYERAGTDNKLVLTDINGNTLGTYQVHNKFDYMTLPILARANFGKKVVFFINAGPYFEVLIKEKEVSGSPYGNFVANNTANFKRFDTGITEGLGFLIPIGQMFAVSFEARDNTGLYNISSLPVYNGAIKTNTTNFIFAFIYKLVTHGKSSKEKAAKS